MANPESHQNQNRSGSWPAGAHVAEDEARLLDYLEGRLADDERQAAEEHVAACAHCRALCQQWQQLEFALTQGLRRPTLSAGFLPRLQEQIRRSSALEARPVARAQERAQLEAELPARWAEQRKRFLRAELPGLLDRFGYGVVAAVAGGLLAHFASAWLRSSSSLGNQAALSVSVGVSSVIMLAAFGFIARHRLGRWLEAL